MDNSAQKNKDAEKNKKGVKKNEHIANLDKKIVDRTIGFIKVLDKDLKIQLKLLGFHDIPINNKSVVNTFIENVDSEILHKTINLHLSNSWFNTDSLGELLKGFKGSALKCLILFDCKLSITNDKKKEGPTGWNQIADLILETNIEHIQLKHMSMSKDDVKEFIEAFINNTEFKRSQLKYIVMCLSKSEKSDLDWIRKNFESLIGSKYMKHFFLVSSKLGGTQTQHYSSRDGNYKCDDCQLCIPESPTPKPTTSANFKF